MWLCWFNCVGWPLWELHFRVLFDFQTAICLCFGWKLNISAKNGRPKLIACIMASLRSKTNVFVSSSFVFIFLTENFIKNSAMTFLHVSTWFVDYIIIIIIIVSFDYYATQTLWIMWDNKNEKEEQRTTKNCFMKIAVIFLSIDDTKKNGEWNIFSVHEWNVSWFIYFSPFFCVVSGPLHNKSLSVA